MTPVKAIPLAIASALILAGCSDNSSDSPSSPPSEPTVTLSGIALDGDYLSDATVCLDQAMNNSCTGEIVGTTDSDGKFSLEVPESAAATGSQILVIPGSHKSSGALYRTLIDNSENSHSLTVSPFTTQVSDKVAMGENNNLPFAIRQAQSEVIEQNDFSANDQSIIFGDFLSHHDHDNYDAIVTRARESKLWLERAREREAELKNNPDYAQWDSIHVVAWNIWQHSFHTHAFFERYEESVHLKKKENGKKIERIEGTQWFVDENGIKTDDILQNWTESKKWDTGQLTVHTFFEFDYNRDGLFQFQGEKAAIGTYQYNDQGLLVMDMMELYNEGDPSLEGGNEQPARKFCPNFDILSELNKLSSKDPFDPCVDFVEQRMFKDSIDSSGTPTEADLMTEWQKPGNASLPVEMSSPAYYEERYTYWLENGGKSSEIFRDWEAKSENLKLDNPFNVVQKDSITSEGVLFNKIMAPGWDNPPEREFAVPNSSLRPLNQVNLVAWNQFAPTYHSETSEKDLQGNRNLSIEAFILNTSSKETDSGKKIQLNLPVEDENPILTARLQWNNKLETLAGEWTFSPIRNGVDESIDSDHGPDKKVYVKQTLVHQDSVKGIRGAYQTTQVEGAGVPGRIEKNPVFTPDFFSDISWSVVSKDLPAELMKLLFNGGTQFRFIDRIPAKELQPPANICWDQDIFSVDFNTLNYRGGDMIVSIRCGDGWWLRDQYMLRIKEPLDQTGHFTAELMTWKKGGNSFIDSPAEKYNLTFTRVQ
ncbi:hypothetical protein [Endozoicomonas lisbonensis]|uniref:Carboxypeptidase regulatory-like domain-containing protein n=1 Tax=Endozoicomonas lisbonensis TaxID=3120522 RepID=A0ABV2SKS3_9GAMM